MRKYLITISREFGCNGREIARNIASDLGIEILDRDLVDMAAAKAGIHLSNFWDGDKIVNKEGDIDSLYGAFGYGSEYKFYSQEAVTAQAQVIRDLANSSGSKLFFGRCADYILREFPNLLNIYLYAPLDYRIMHMAEAYNLTMKQSEKLVKSVDMRRASYYKYVTGQKRGDIKFKHIMLDTSKFSIDEIKKIIRDIVESKFSN